MLFLKLAISIIILYFVARNIDWTKTFDFLKNANPWLLIMCVFLLLALLYLRALRWRYLARSFKAQISFKESFYQNTVSLAFANATPARFGEAIKIKFLKEQSKITYFRAILIAIFEKTADFAILLFCLLLGCVLIFFGESFSWLVLVIFVSYCGLLIVSIVFIKPFFKIAFKLAKRFKKRIDPFFIPQKNYALILGISLLSWFILIGQTYTISEAIDANISFSIFIFLIPLMALSGLFPLSLGGIGIRDALTVFLLARFGLALEQALLISVLYTFINYLIPVFIGIYLYLQRKQPAN